MDQPQSPIRRTSLNISYPDIWKEYVDNNQAPYGKACVTYAERWADLMEQHMAQGSVLEDIAAASSHEADIEGITGFMYGAAVSMLVRCWEHGEQLRRWHNLEIQIDNEGEKANETGGVLNPALLTIR